MFRLTAVHVEDIIFHMFQYIQKLRTEGPQAWVFEECKVFNVVKISDRGAAQTWPTYFWLVEKLIEQQDCPWQLRLSDSNWTAAFTVSSVKYGHVK